MNTLKNIKNDIFKYLSKVTFLSIITISLFFLFSGCRSMPEDLLDTRTIPQLIEHLKESGLKIEKVQHVRYQAVLASDGRVMVVDGCNVEFYAYDMNEEYQRDKLRKVRKHGYIVVLGYKIPAITNGRFIMMTYSENPNKIKVIRAFRNFKLK